MEKVFDLSKPDERVSFAPMNAPAPVNLQESCDHRWQIVVLQVGGPDEKNESRVMEHLYCPLCGKKHTWIFVIEWETRIVRRLTGEVICYPALERELNQGAYSTGIPDELRVYGEFWIRTGSAEGFEWKKVKT